MRSPRSWTRGSRSDRSRLLHRDGPSARQPDDFLQRRRIHRAQPDLGDAMAVNSRCRAGDRKPRRPPCRARRVRGLVAARIRGFSERRQHRPALPRRPRGRRRDLLCRNPHARRLPGPIPQAPRASRQSGSRQHPARDRVDRRRCADTGRASRPHLHQARRDRDSRAVWRRRWWCPLRVNRPAASSRRHRPAHKGHGPAVHLEVRLPQRRLFLRGADRPGQHDGCARSFLGRCEPLVVDPEARRQGRRDTGLHESHVVQGDATRRLPWPVCRALRRSPRRDDGHRPRGLIGDLQDVGRAAEEAHRGSQAASLAADQADASRGPAVSTTTDAKVVRRNPEIVVRGQIVPPPVGWLKWLGTTDHKRIGVMYIVASFMFFLIGGSEALLMRSQLAVPNNTLVDAAHYNQVLTLHGTTMVFLFIVPIWAGLANYLVPLQIGARDMAFPRLNALSFWLFLAGGLVFYGSIFFHPADAGWFSYTPLSDKTYSPSGGQDSWILLIHLTGLASILGAINIVATIANMPAPGMGWSRLPLFCWGVLTQAIMLIVALPAIAAAVTMLLTDRHFGTCFFDPHCGGSPLLWQHLFWFFGHPEVYIMILPGFGVISEVLPVFARKPIFGYKAIAGSTVGIAFLSMLVWAHHMFTAPIPVVVLAFFMLSSLLIAVPTGVKVINWVATLWRGTIEFKTPLYFACGFLVLFTLGGLTGVMLAIFPIDWQVHGSYFVVAHFHFVLVAGSVSSIMAAL